MNQARDFLKDKQNIRVSTTVLLVIGGIIYLVQGVFGFDIIFETIGLGSVAFYRFWSILIGSVLLAVGLAAYAQNKPEVDKTLNKVTKKVVEEAKEIGGKAVETTKDAAEKVTDEVKERKEKGKKSENDVKKEKKTKKEA